jgi:hypothetical protein
MTDIFWDCILEFARRLGIGIVIPQESREKDYYEIFDWVSETFRRSNKVMYDHEGYQVPFWRWEKHKSKVYIEALEQAQIAAMRADIERIKKRIQQARDDVGMNYFQESAEAVEARTQLEALQKKPPYTGRHRDIVKLALKAGRPVPVSVVTDYLDEPWAVSEMVRRGKYLGIRIFSMARQRATDSASASQTDYPILHELLRGRQGKPLVFHALFFEDTWASNFLDQPFVCFCDVFPTAADAEKNIPVKPAHSRDPKRYHSRSISIRRTDGEMLAVGSGDVSYGGTDAALMLKKVEARLNSN